MIAKNPKVEAGNGSWQLPAESEKLAEARKASKVLVGRISETEKRLAQLEDRRKQLITQLASPATGADEQEKLREDARDAAARKLVAGEELAALKNELVNARSAVKQALENGRAKELLEASEEAKRLAVNGVIETFAELLPNFYRMYAEAQLQEAELRAEVYHCERGRPREDQFAFATKVLEKAVGIIGREGSPLQEWANTYE